MLVAFIVKDFEAEATIQRCREFSIQWAFDNFIMVDSRSDVAVEAALIRRDIQRVVIACGTHTALWRLNEMAGMAEKCGRELWCFGETADHRPRHPVGVGIKTEPVRWPITA